ncbi:acetylhydrolase [Fusarium albosuccineum]|uniref:Putative phospholipase n=1 Tax=Fusarium albosuccineum TaxID=1237068 RepID=A0A8H4LR12_9HYPO|nr:acetylhydrolase [Fusarium albosuccineum]
MPHPNTEQDLELNSLSDDDDPDLPLIMAQPDAADAAPAAPAPKPRWLDPRPLRWWSRWTSSPVFQKFTDRLKELVRPRFTWRYVVCAIIGVYVLYCFVTWQPFFSSALPAYSGPHNVGAIDLEIPLEKPKRLSDTILKSTREPAFEVETVLFTVYYPAVKGARSSASLHPWVPRPLSLTAEGYARAAGVNNFIIRPIFTFALWLLVGGIKIPARVDVPLLGSNVEGTDKDGEKFPVMIFSHGSVSSRTDYTHYLGELASRGHIVAALEHRDGSCPGSLVKVKGKKDRRVVLLKERDLESTPPMNDTILKKEQLAFRTEEIFETIRVLRDVNDGEGWEVFTSSSRNEGHALAAWANRLDFNHLTINGHSYGATGALQALKTANTTASNPAIGGIALDPGKSSGQLNAEVPVPLLVVHSNSWSKTHSIFFGRPHFDTVLDLVRGVRDKVGSAWFLTSIGTAHPSVTDAPLLQPLLLNFATGATADVRKALGEYVKVTIDFLDFTKTGEKNGILREEVTHEEYGKWVSEERKKTFPKDLAKYWEVHVCPLKQEQ